MRFNMMNLPFYNKKKLILAFEMGVTLSNVAHEMKIELTPAIVERCEDIIKKEYGRNNPSKLAGQMTAYILASFETK